MSLPSLTSFSTWAPGPKQLNIIKILLVLLALTPLIRLGGDLGANPAEFVSHHTGTWTFNFLLFTLLITPLRTWTGAHWLLRLRRTLGLVTFFYAALHLSAFLVFDHSLEWMEIAQDIVDRPGIAVGFAAFVLMVPLALTSSNRAVTYLGGKRWRELHRAIYAIGILAAIHYLWLSKITTYFYPLTYALLLFLLLGWRAAKYLDKARTPMASKPAGEQPVQFFRQRPKE